MTARELSATRFASPRSCAGAATAALAAAAARRVTGVDPGVPLPRAQASGVRDVPVTRAVTPFAATLSGVDAPAVLGVPRRPRTEAGVPAAGAGVAPL